MRLSDRRSRLDPGALPWALSLALLVLPTAVLAALAARLGSGPVWAGAGVSGLFALVLLRHHPVWRPPAGGMALAVYLIALVWLWVPTRGLDDAAVRLGRGVLLVVGVGLAARYDLDRTGAEDRRRAAKWAGRLTRRAKWPADLADARAVPEVDRLREAVRADAGPALALLADARPAVRVAALGALEYRPHWRPGEAEVVRRVIREARDPAVRAAAAYALAGADAPGPAADLAGLLRDPAPEVRFAAGEALLWDAEYRWPAARDAVRDALADPRRADDGPLFTGPARLPPEAVADLTTWAAECPPLSTRAVLTLIGQYRRALADNDPPGLAADLAAFMLAPDAPPGLRVELAALLREHGLLGPDVLDRMTGPDQPGPLRLFAAEVLLLNDPADSDGLDVLRGLARHPNRELAVQVGAVVQGVLGVDVGLVPGEEAPATTSRAAAEVARRVAAWANGLDPNAPPTPVRRRALWPAPGRGSSGVL